MQTVMTIVFWYFTIGLFLTVVELSYVAMDRFGLMTGIKLLVLSCALAFVRTLVWPFYWSTFVWETFVRRSNVRY